MHPSALVWALSQLISAPFVPYMSAAIWTLCFSKSLSAKSVSTHPGCRRAITWRECYALFPCSPMWRHLPSSDCSHCHQLAPAARENLSTWGQKGKPFSSQPLFSIALITMSPSVLHIHLVSSVLHWKVLGECTALGDYTFVILWKTD